MSYSFVSDKSATKSNKWCLTFILQCVIDSKYFYVMIQSAAYSELLEAELLALYMKKRISTIYVYQVEYTHA